MVDEKSKFNPISCHGQTEGEWTYSCTFYVTSALDGEGGLYHTPAALPLGMSRYPMYRRLGGGQKRQEPVRKISPSPRSDPLTVQTAASRYTDYTILVHADDCTRHNITSAKSLFLMTVQVPIQPSTVIADSKIGSCSRPTNDNNFMFIKPFS